MLQFWDWYFRNTRLEKMKIPEPKVGGKFISRWVYFGIKVNMNNIRCPHTIR